MVVAMRFTAFNPSYNLWFIAKFSIGRHREERSDEAIHLPLPRYGLLRSARNDG
jgi:hypothetical protein